MKIKSLLTLMVCFASITIFGQNKNLEKAEVYLYKYKFDKAIKIYKDELKENSRNIKVKEMLALAYWLNNDRANALLAYENLVNQPYSNPLNQYMFAQLLAQEERYDEASAYYKKYFENRTTENRSRDFLNYLDHISALKQQNAKVDLIPVLADPMLSEISPIEINGELHFMQDQSNNIGLVKHLSTNGSDGFYQIYKQDVTQQLQFVDNINSKFHTGPISYDAKNKLLYVTETDKAYANSSRLLIRSYKWVNDGWADAGVIIQGNGNYSVSHPAINEDGNKLYFVSDKSGGYGETDIYVVYKKVDGWGDAINLGKYINSPGRELFPFVKGNQLYFSSDGYAGLGGMDLYHATFENGQWAAVTNLGNGFNTSSDDFAISLTKTGEGYFTSNRNGSDDIFSFKTENFDLIAIIKDAETGFPLQAASMRLFENGKEKYSKSNVGKNAVDFRIPLKPNTQYKVEFEHEGYKMNVLGFKTGTEATELEVPINMEKLIQNGLELEVSIKTFYGDGIANAKVIITDLENDKQLTAKTNAFGIARLQVETDREYRADIEHSSFMPQATLFSSKGFTPNSVIGFELQLAGK